MGFKPLGESSSESSGGFRPLQPGTVSVPIPEDDHAPLDLTNEEMDALPAQLSRQYGQRQPSIADTARAIVENMTVGKAEAGMSLGTGFAAQIPAGLAGLATLNPDNVNKVAEALTYEPRTAAGKRMAGAFQYPLEKYEQGADWAGETARELGATPAQAAALKTTLLIPPYLKTVVPRTAVSTYVRPPEPPGGPNPIEEWLARKAEQRAGPIQDVTEVGGVEPGKQIVPTEPARPSGGFRPLEPERAAPEERLANPIPVDVSPAEKVARLNALTEENKPIVQAAMRDIDTEFGTESKDNVKLPAAILEKSQRPSIRETKPWFDVEHIRDAYRFKTQIEDASEIPTIVERLVKSTGATVVKADIKKQLQPKEWGFRASIFDLKMPNGQLVEWYLPVREIEAVKDAHHILYEKWRNKDIGKLSRPERQAMKRDMATSRNGFQDAWGRYLARTGQDESAVRAALEKASALGPSTGLKDLARESPLTGEVQRSGGSQEPPTLSAVKPSSPITSTRPSSALETMSPIDGIIQGNEPHVLGVQASQLVKKTGTGRLIGAFGGNINAVTGALRRMERLARQGEAGRPWYRDSANSFVEALGGDRNAAERVAMVIGLTSTGHEVKGNLTMTIKALEQYARGEPIRVATGDTNRKIEALLYRGVVPDSVKANDFYRSLSQYITGETYERAVTDRHQFRIASGDESRTKGTRQQYEYSAALAAETAKRLGWPVGETQAAMWVAKKANDKYADMKASIAESKNSKYAGKTNAELKKIAMDFGMVSFASEIKARDWKPPEGIKFPPLEELRKVGLDEKDNKMAKDMFDQLEFLDEKARDLGYPDARALFGAKPREFNRLAEEWGNQHELTVGTNREMHALDRISVSLEEPTGKIAKTLQAKFEPEVYLERYQRHLVPKERTVIAAAVRDVISAGMPEHVLEAVKGFTASLSGTDASFNMINKTVSIRDILGVPDTVLRGWLAHEMTHSFDNVGKVSENTRSYREVFISASSPRLEVTGIGAWGLEGHGDISREIVGKWDIVKNPELWKFFSYPLGLSFQAELMRVELFAQASRLYLVNPKLMEKELPITYSAMKEIYDNAGTSLEETRAAIRTTLQAPGAAASHAEVRGRAAGELPQAAGGGAVERRPGERVVGVEGGPEHGRRPPDEGKRSVVGVQGPNPHWDIDQPGLIDNLTRQWQNNQIDLKKVQEAIERFGGVIKERGNAYLAEELYRDRVTSRIKRAFKNGIEPILKDIKNANLTVDEAGKYLWARHAPERNAQMGKINPGKDDLSGLSNAEASRILASYPQAKRQALDRIGERIDALTASTRQILVKNGLEEPSTIAAWEGAYKHYVPLFRDVDEIGTGSGFQVRGPESKRATGSHREAQAVLAATIAQHERAIVRAEKARVGRALISLAEEFPNPDFWKVDQPPMKRTVNPTTGLVQVGVDPMYRQRDDVLIVKQADPSGKVVERVLAFNPKNERAVALAHAMKNLDTVQLGAVTKVVGKVTRILANLATSWNPLFWTTNFARDVQTAGVNLQSTPLRGRAPQIFANIPRALSGILSAEFSDGKGKWATAYRQFEMEGGKMEWASIFNDLVERSEDLAAQIKSSQRGDLNPAKWGALGIDMVEKANSAIENGTRLATFVEGVDRGLSPMQAASIAKNLTVNFRRKGNQSTATGAWYMFFNANVQGTARMIQGIAKSRKAQAIVGTMVAFGAALELVNRMIGEQNKDEDGNNPYELIPEDVRQKNMIFMLPGGKHASLPLAYGFSVFHNAGRMIMEHTLAASSSKLVDEKKKPLEGAWNFAKVLIDSFMPLGNTTTPAQFIAPSILDPAVQYAENKTWYGGPIRPEPQSFGPSTPNHKLYFRDTSDMAKDLTKWLSDLTGGDEVQGGSIDISPTTITHILGTAGGGAGQFGLGMFDFTNHMVKRVAGEETSQDLPWRKVPFVGKFYGEVDDRDKAAKFYRLRSEAMDVWKKMETYRKSGDYDKAAQVEEENPALAAMARELISKSFKKEMKGFREEFKTSVELPRSERQRERDRLRAEEVSTMARAIQAYNDAARESR